MAKGGLQKLPWDIPIRRKGKENRDIHFNVWEIECNCYRDWENDEHMSITY
jgi:hypothetical protein